MSELSCACSVSRCQEGFGSFHMTCRVSIILPALNESAQIGAAIDSAVRAGADEIIVVDGGSQDGTREIAADRGSRVLSSEAGRAKQQNAGAAVAGGDLLLFQHADCIVPSALP